MKILVIEDNLENIEGARRQLAEGNELTIMTSFTEFFETFYGKCLDKDAGIRNLSSFDCVLTDINLPSPHDQKGEVDGATGFVIVLKAIEAQVKYIGALTDASHHCDVHSKAMDLWFRQEKPFMAGMSKVVLDNYNHVCAGLKLWKSLLVVLTKE